MTRALVVTALGLVLLAAGFLFSPWPWMAGIATGAFFGALGVVYLFRMEVDE